jgi:hypothetical protein
MTVTPALTWSTSDKYVIQYGGFENYVSGGSGGTAISNQLFVGTAQAAVTSPPATGILGKSYCPCPSMLALDAPASN